MSKYHSHSKSFAFQSIDPKIFPDMCKSLPIYGANVSSHSRASVSTSPGISGKAAIKRYSSPSSDTK